MEHTSYSLEQNSVTEYTIDNKHMNQTIMDTINEIKKKMSLFRLLSVQY